MRSRRLRSRQNRGSALLMVTVAIAALISFAIIAIDGAVLMTTKGQLQKAADAAALAGASGLLAADEAEATDRAIAFAGFNRAVQDSMRDVVITPDDVSFPEADHIRVTTHRTAATGDPLRTYFRRIVDPFNSNTADVTAVAEAWCYDVCETPCLKPWSIPDRWNDVNANNKYDAGEAYDPDVTGYKAPGDIGLSIVLKVGNPQQAIERGVFFPVCYPPLDYPGEKPLSGGEWYRTWISECEPYLVGPGDRLQTETGNKSGPTRQGVTALLAQDPGARWNASSGTVVNSAYGTSPRIVLVPFFDPTRPPTSGGSWVHVTRVGAFFIEGQNGQGDVVGRFMKITTQGLPCPGGGNGSSMVKGIGLIE
ncbi:MAG TPA: pilus assembly protein TadG-related protein [Candidatus Krumholzibacteria bacterium]|nr:pilus assembly protein TadG-related protein [Candidatus Krumholzibacteria bacterium]